VSGARHSIPVRMPFVRVGGHSRKPDAVAVRLAQLIGGTVGSADVWLSRGSNERVALALRAHREAGAWGRRASWAAPLVAELDQYDARPLDNDLILEHHAADSLDDTWRVAFLNNRNTETHHQWCKAAARFHALNMSLMMALKAADK
jgi:hypothetical protein